MIKVGNKTFKTKETLKNYCKYILNNAEINTLLQGEWLSVMTDVLKMHEDFEGKTKGLDYSIGVRPCFINPRNNQFYILRADGSDTDFSYIKCISAKSKQSRIKEALRFAVRDQVEDYKNEYFKKFGDSSGYVVCPTTNLKIKKKDSHVDHFPKQFDEIVKEWIDKNNISSDLITLTRPSDDNATAWDMEDKDLLEDFILFHYRVAEYRVVLNKVNLQRKRAAKYEF